MTIRKTLLIAGAAIVFCLALAVILLLFPNPLFANHIKYKKYNLYSGKPVKHNYQSILDKSLQLAATSEIFDSTYTYDIFLTEGVWYKKYAETLLGPSLARSIDNNILLNGSVNFVNNELGTSSKRDLTQTIAHEMTHCLMLNKYGIFKINPLHHPPLWKIEGYPEFIALHDEIAYKGYDFHHTVAMMDSLIKKGDEWIEVKLGFFDPLSYFKARVLVEFLITKKNMTLDQIMNDNVKEDDVYNQLMLWHSNKY